MLARFWMVVLSLAAFALPARADTQPRFVGFHADPAHSGSYIVPGLTWATAPRMHRVTSFQGIIKGIPIAQPLYWLPPGAAHGRIIVANTSGWVQAFDSVTGGLVWERQVSPTLPVLRIPCGTGSPYGIIGTPVIDTLLGRMFFNTLTLEKGVQQHEIYGISLVDGSVLPGWPVNVQTALQKRGYAFNPSNQDQRGALAIAQGTLYVAYGGLGGDCGSYHGWVLGIQKEPPVLSGVWVTSGEWGGIWSEGGVTSDGTSLFVNTGNTIVGTPSWADGEAVIRLPSNLEHSADPHNYFAPANWQQLDRADLDIGATGPLPIDVPTAAGGVAPLLYTMNKGGTAYLLDRANLGGIGGNLFSRQVTTAKTITAPAAYASSDGVFVAFAGNGSGCPRPGANTLTVLDVTDDPSPAISTAWCAAMGATGTPIATTSDGRANSMVWVTGALGDDRLHGFRGDTGGVLFAGGGPSEQMGKLNRFNTILAAEGRLFVAGTDRLYAFSPDPNQK